MKNNFNKTISREHRELLERFNELDSEYRVTKLPHKRIPLKKEADAIFAKLLFVGLGV